MHGYHSLAQTSFDRAHYGHQARRTGLGLSDLRVRLTGAAQPDADGRTPRFLQTLEEIALEERKEREILSKIEEIEAAHMHWLHESVKPAARPQRKLEGPDALRLGTEKKERKSDIAFALLLAFWMSNYNLMPAYRA